MNGSKIVRYDENDKIMFDIIKDDWNEFNANSNTSIRVPTLRTLPGYIEKLKGMSFTSISMVFFSFLGVNPKLHVLSILQI